MYFTPAQILEIAELSISFATTDTLKGKLFSPRINPKLFVLLDMETAALRFAYNQSPTYPNIQWVANYVYDLCGIYAIRARNALDPGGIPVIPVTPGSDTYCNGVEYITSANFELNGTTVINADWANKQMKLFWNNIPKFIKEGIDWVYVFGGGFQIIIPRFDASPGGPNEDVEIYDFVGCFTPGSIVPPIQMPINNVISVTGVDDYDLIWTTALTNKYGTGSFFVSQDDGSGNYFPTAIQPIPDNVDAPSKYTFSGLGGLNTRITIS